MRDEVDPPKIAESEAMASVPGPKELTAAEKNEDGEKT